MMASARSQRTSAKTRTQRSPGLGIRKRPTANSADDYHERSAEQSSERRETPAAFKAQETCFLTVDSLIPSSAAISLLVCPLHTREATARTRILTCVCRKIGRKTSSCTTTHRKESCKPSTRWTQTRRRSSRSMQPSLNSSGISARSARCSFIPSAGAVVHTAPKASFQPTSVQLSERIATGSLMEFMSRRRSATRPLLSTAIGRPLAPKAG